ncbi:MAG TPA: TMEM165/GDT1 family protein [Candidatus Angelobacter sp.]|nr:TMEM165/GDT1 family protein [Candidatus Angelobacter sp.]
MVMTAGGGLSLGSVILLAFWTVLLSELVGDKAMYVLPSLAVRFRGAVVFAAFTVSSAVKMLVAVLLGSSIIRFQSRWTYLVSAVAFFISAILIWVEDPEEATREFDQKPWKGASACFGFFFFMEWGDPGQIAAAALALKSHLLLATWMGATAAIVAKGGVALGLGLKLRDRLPQRMLRLVASGSCCALGILAATQMLMR